MQQDASNEMSKINARKLKYRAPALVCFGKVSDLTQAGGASPPENSTGGGKCSQNAAKSCLSDPVAKENIVRVGTHPFGIGLYLFDYKPKFQAQWGYGRQFGVMADEVEAVMPEAVCEHANGYKMVDYAMLGVAYSIH